MDSPGAFLLCSQNGQRPQPPATTHQPKRYPVRLDPAGRLHDLRPQGTTAGEYFGFDPRSIGPAYDVLDPGKRVPELQGAMAGRPANTQQPPQTEIRSPQYYEGAADMKKRLKFLDGMTQGERDGAEFWASVRSVSGRHTCDDDERSTSKIFKNGCSEAKDWLVVVDKSRKASEECRLGWSGK
jgi:hypothetical protein